jgi:hypothetical protein
MSSYPVTKMRCMSEKEPTPTEIFDEAAGRCAELHGEDSVPRHLLSLIITAAAESPDPRFWARCLFLRMTQELDRAGIPPEGAESTRH